VKQRPKKSEINTAVETLGSQGLSLELNIKNESQRMPRISNNSDKHSSLRIPSESFRIP
jgi:hypothetical protein